MAPSSSAMGEVFETSDSLSNSQDPATKAPPPRLFVSPTRRVITAMKAGAVTGAVLGVAHGSKTAALRFRAEHTHKLPTSTKGWYLYHKSKNYHVMLSGAKEGIAMGFKVAFWVGLFFGIEASIDRLRGGDTKKDFASTTVAGLSVAGAFSLWNRFPLATAARTAKMGLVGGLAYGLAQDALSLARGRRIAYVDFLLGKGGRRITTRNMDA